MSPSPGRLADAAHYLATHPTARRCLLGLVSEHTPRLFIVTDGESVAALLSLEPRYRSAFVELAARGMTTAYDPARPETLRPTELGKRAYPEALRLLTRAGQS